MRKCQICHEDECISAWQPFGPEPNCRDDGAFTALGSHYRGFPVIAICHNCKGEIQNGEHVSFVYPRKSKQINPKVYKLVGELSPLVLDEAIKIENGAVTS